MDQQISGGAPAAPPPRGPSRLGLLSAVMRISFRLLVLIILALTAIAVYNVGDMIRWLAWPADDTIHERRHSLAAGASNKVAIITVNGAILSGEGFVKRQIDRVRDDPEVKAIVLRVNSPGGTVTASDYLYHHLRKLADERSLPLVVSMGGISASGGYYLSMAVGDTPDSIFAEPSTWTGSIGVIIPHYNVAGLLERWQIEEDSIKSHPLKQMGNPARKLTEQEREIFQALVDESFGRFKEVVLKGRPKLRDDPPALDRVATGQVFTTQQALRHGLVDREGFVEDAIGRALELANLTPDNAQAVEYLRPPSIADVLLAKEAGVAQVRDLEGVLDLLSPRAYYLCTWLPSIGWAPDGE